MLGGDDDGEEEVGGEGEDEVEQDGGIEEADEE